MKASQSHIKTNCIRWLTAGLLAIVSFSLQADIVGSKHDLGTGGAGQSAGGTGEVCVFCHTPHGSDTSNEIPLWNKTLPGIGNYTRYSSLNTVSLDGTELPIGSVSLACLSCHDGTQAMDVVINAPGRGMGSGSITGGPPAMLAAGTPVPMLGLDLRDDHPISIQYAGGGCLSTDADGPCPQALGDPDFNAPQLATINSTKVWWVDSAVGASGVREKTDMALYNRLESGKRQPTVECGSCHDPHNEGTGTASDSVSFLRVVNTDSRICITCHNK